MPTEEDEPLEVYWDDLRLARSRAPQEEARIPSFRDQVQDGDMAIGTSQGRILVIIRPSGELVYGPEYTPDEAATIFWENMGQRRLQMEDRLLVIQHMEAVLVRLGRADMECERFRREAAEEEGDMVRKAELTQRAEISLSHLNMIAHQAIELGRGLAGRPEIPIPAVPIRVPSTLRTTTAEYAGREGLPPEEPESEPEG